MQSRIGNLQREGLEWYAKEMMMMRDNYQDHLTQILKALTRYCEHRMYLNKEKFQFRPDICDIPGGKVRNRKVHVANKEVWEGKKLHTPETKKELSRHESNHLLLFTNASLTKFGSALAVGTNWWVSKIIEMHSCKLSPAEMNYKTHEQELQATFEAFRQFEPCVKG